MAAKAPWNRPYSEVFKVRFCELCDRFKNFYHIYSIPTVLKWATEFPQPSAINAVRQLSAARCNKCLHCGTSRYLDCPGCCLLLSDSYSSLIALGGSHVDQDTIYEYLKTYSTLTNSGKTVILCWIPGHVGIPGNERADRVTKGALSLPVSPVNVSVGRLKMREMKILTAAGCVISSTTVQTTTLRVRPPARPTARSSTRHRPTIHSWTWVHFCWPNPIQSKNSWY